jgi:hypothetical protein
MDNTSSQQHFKRTRARVNLKSHHHKVVAAFHVSSVVWRTKAAIFGSVISENINAYLHQSRQ